MLILIVVYWTYVRFFVPMASFGDMANEVGVQAREGREAGGASLGMGALKN